MKRSAIGNRRLMNSCCEAKANFKRIVKEALTSGLETTVRYPDTPHKTCMMHVMFSVDGKRVLEYWPSNGKAWGCISGERTTSVNSIEESLALAKKEMIRMVHQGG